MSTFDASAYDAGLPATARALPANRSLRSQVAWGGGGFLLGVIVWHFVGFWSFIATVVFRGPDSSSASLSASAPAARPAIAPAKRSQTISGSAPAHGTATASDCSALVLDRSTGTTALAACVGIQQPMRMVQSSPRGDRHIDGQARDGAWSVIVDAYGTRTATGQTLAETSIDAGLDPSLDPRFDPRLGQRAVQLD